MYAAARDDVVTLLEALQHLLVLLGLLFLGQNEEEVEHDKDEDKGATLMRRLMVSPPPGPAAYATLIIEHLLDPFFNSVNFRSLMECRISDINSR